jgi:hypothetical protein
MQWTRALALVLGLMGCEGTFGTQGTQPAALLQCPQDPDCAIGGAGCNVCPDYFVCEDAPSGKRCIGPGPSFPDGGAGWQCADVERGASTVTECRRGGSTVPDGGGGSGWACELQGEFVVCTDDTPDFPDDGDHYDCHYEHELRVCESDGGDHADGGIPVCVAEECGNGIDDDCDQSVDCADADCAAVCEPPPCVEEETIHCPNDLGCNGHLGDNYDECMSWGNEGGCTPEELHAWCTRRLDDGVARERVVRQWVDDRCGGEVVQDGGTYSCRDESTCTTYACTTPLVLVFDEARTVAYSRDDGRSAFDLSARQDGSATRTDWPTAATPWLALDRDGDGRITSGRELFGSATQLTTRIARNGFQALGDLDADRDGDVDHRDPLFADLLVWTDADGDRISTQSELRSIADLGIVSLGVRYEVAPRCDARGNCEVERARFTWRDRAGRMRSGAIVDVHLAIQRPSDLF